MERSGLNLSFLRTEIEEMRQTVFVMAIKTGRPQKMGSNKAFVSLTYSKLYKSSMTSHSDACFFYEAPCWMLGKDGELGG